MSGEPAVIRIKPFCYVHVLDNNSNVTRVEEGPQTFTRQDHEKILAGPEPMILIPPRNYVIIQNPVVRDAKGAVVRSKDNQIKLRHGDSEIRFEQDPFALYPGEKLFGKVTPLQVVAPNTALRIRCIRDYASTDGTKRIAGDEWLFEGPGTYLPNIETQVVEVVRAVIIRPNQALKIRARKDTVDRFGKKRGTSEEWIVRSFGSYLPGVDEEIVETLNAHILTDKKAIHLRAAQTFKDAYGKPRKAGEEWLVTLEDTEAHILDVFEQFVAEVKLTTVSKREFCVVLDPWKEGKQLLGVKDLRKGEVSFFLQPGEKLERGIQPVIILSEEEALLLRAIQNFVDDTDEAHNAGDRWMINGPTDFVPPIEVEVLEKRKIIALDENEGVYVRDIKTGRVRVVSGQSYLLKPNEELWSKELPRIVEELLNKDKDHVEERDKTKLVTFKTPHNSAVQIYDYKQKKSRVLFGPDLVLLQPDEEFTVVQLSGGHPKKPNQIKSLCLLLGPDFMTDLVIVETADHARLSLKLSYNWYFDVDKTKEEEATKLFAVGDFVGETCKAIASRVRGTVASVTFDQFHRNSAKVIQTALFGDGLADNLRFNTNNLVMTNVDIQSVEPVDQRTRDSLQKSVQLAIEITTSSQEAAARHESERTEQEAVGRLERQKISDEAAAERARTALVQLQAECAAIESTGQATAEAKARAEAAKIEGEAAVKQAELSAQAARIKSESDLTNLKKKQHDEIEHQKAFNKLEIERSQLLSDIEAEKFAGLVQAIGADTIEAMANAGPEMQAKLLKSLGLTSFLITDGNSPINLFNTAQGLVSQPQ